jgi:2-polyprenyl-6-methoxyphenol hydroxylase-like FAD-dependent oxidoreductase
MRAHQEVLAAIQRISNDRVQGREGTGFNFCHDTSLDPESQGEPMRIAVIGGSTAGLASALRLRQSGHEVSVFERRSGTSTGGFGLLLTPSARQGMRRIGVNLDSLGYPVEQSDIRDEDGRSILSQGLHDTVGIERAKLQDALLGSLEPGILQLGKSFLGFESDPQGGARAAIFSDGTRVEADLFIGADGVRSNVRSSWTPGPALRQVQSVELVGMYRGDAIPEILNGRFLKFCRTEDGISIGMVPTSTGSVTWYIQCDPRRWPICLSPQEEKRAWLQEEVQRWPDPVAEIILGSDLNRTHLWRTTDRDLPTHFHRSNVLLVGDAAHPLLTFTSQGTGSAIEDALAIGDLLDHHVSRTPEPEQLDGILCEFSRHRIPILRARLQMGRRMQSQFLNPTRRTQQIVPICS